MGHLKQSAKEELIASLVLPAVCIQFFDHYSYCAAAISRSKNPVKAAMTLLAKENIQEELQKFVLRVRARQAAKPVLPDEILPLLRGLGVDTSEPYHEVEDPEDSDEPEHDPEDPGVHGPFGSHEPDG